MNENIDLTEILKGCPKGTELYSTIYGKVRFEGISNYAESPIEIKFLNKFTNSSLISAYFAKDGRCSYSYDGECTLFPAKDQRDWAKFERFWDKPKVEKFNPKTLKPFDKVLVKYRLDCDFDWECDLFSHIDNKDDEFPCHCVGTNYRYCIPYNNETKHLVGTTNDCPDYYKWWEEQVWN